MVTFDDGEQYNGMVREKAQFPMIRGPNGEVQRKAFSRYFVRLKEMGDREALLDDCHMRRDRKVFTKQNLRSFLKHSLQRESWNGAPWLAKEPLAIQYHLSMEIPAHLMQDAKLLQQKVGSRIGTTLTLLVADNDD
nr:imitation switch two complex protein 1 [Quercus suber]